MRVHVAPYPHQQTVLSQRVFYFGPSNRCVRYLIVLICDSLIQFFDIQHLFLCLFVVHLFFDKVSVQVFCPLFNWITHFLFVEFKNSLHSLDNNSLSDVFCKYFLPVCGSSSTSLDILFCRPEVLKFNEVLLLVYFMNLAFGVIFKKSLLYSRSFRFSSMLPYRSFAVCMLYYINSNIHIWVDICEVCMTCV